MAIASAGGGLFFCGCRLNMTAVVSLTTVSTWRWSLFATATTSERKRSGAKYE